MSTREPVFFRPGDLDTDSNVPVTKKVAILDVGTKYNIARCLLKRGCALTIYPADTKAETIAAAKPDGIMLTNGPGDPKECTGVIEELKKLYETDIPIFAICLGHQLMALASGENEIRPPRFQPPGKRHTKRPRLYFLPEPRVCGKGRFRGRLCGRGCFCKCQRRLHRGFNIQE